MRTIVLWQGCVQVCLRNVVISDTCKCMETEERERPFTLYHRWIGSLIKKGEAGERGKKYTEKTFWRIKNIHRKKDATSFFKTCTSFRWNLLHLFLKGAMCFWKRCYVFKQIRVANWWKYMDFDWHCHNLFFHDY